MASGVEDVASLVTGEQNEVFIPEFGLLSLKYFELSNKKYEGGVFRLSAEAIKNVSELMGFSARFEAAAVRQAYMDVFRTEGTTIFEIEKNTKPTDIALRFARDRWVPKEDKGLAADVSRPWIKTEYQAKFISEALLSAVAEQLRLVGNQSAHFFMRINFKERTFGLITEEKYREQFPVNPFFHFSLPSLAMVAKAREADRAAATTPPEEASPPEAPSFASEVSRGSPFSQVRPTAPPPPAEPELVPAVANIPEDAVPSPAESGSHPQVDISTATPVEDAPPAVPNMDPGAVLTTTGGEPQPGQAHDLTPAVSQMPAAQTDTPQSPALPATQSPVQAGRESADQNRTSAEPARSQEQPPAAEQTAAQSKAPQTSEAPARGQVNRAAQANVRSKEFQAETRRETAVESQAKYATYSRSEIDHMMKQQTENITSALGSKISSQQRSFQEAVEKQEKSFTKLIDTFSAQVETARAKLDATVSKAQESTRIDIETFKKDLSKELDQQRTQINKSVLPVAKFIESTQEKPLKAEKKSEAQKAAVQTNPLMMKLLYLNAGLAVGAIAIMLFVLLPLGQRLEKIELEMSKNAPSAGANSTAGQAR